MQRPDFNTKPAQQRLGVTLTEVLMSLMIMSIGVASVATLFPIAALRSAQATKLTNAAILKYNIEALIQARPELVFDPDGDFTGSNFGAITEHFRRNSEKNYIVDPFGYYLMAGMNPDPTTLVGTIGAGTDANRRFADYFGNIAFDGSNGTGSPFDNTQTTTPLQRYDGGIRALQNLRFGGVLANDTLPAFEAMASELANLGDGWHTVIDEVASAPLLIGGDTVGVTLDSEVDLSALVPSQQYVTSLNAGSVTIPDPEFTKITVFSLNGQFSNSFPLTQVVGNTCRWDEPVDLNGNGIVEPRALPQEFGGNIGRVLIQTRRTQDFNWMLTVRREADGRASGVDVVVVFSGGRSPDHERVFNATFTAGAFGVIVAKTSGSDLNGDAAEPFLKRGGFVLDVVNARWYRVANYQDNPADGGATYLVTLESAAVESSSAGAVFLPGVVDVYPLGSLPIPEEMIPPTF